MAAAWSSWYRDVLPQLPDCPALRVDLELRRAAQLLFGTSRNWRVEMSAVAVPAATTYVPIVPSDTGQELVAVEQIYFDGNELDLMTAEDAAEEFGSDWNTQTGTPQAYILHTPGVARLVPIPASAATKGITATISVRPSETSTGIPDDLAVAYREVLAAGAKGRLMLMANKPWSDPNTGILNATAFQQAVSTALLMTARGNGARRVASRKAWC